MVLRIDAVMPILYALAAMDNVSLASQVDPYWIRGSYRTMIEMRVVVCLNQAETALGSILDLKIKTHHLTGIYAASVGSIEGDWTVLVQLLLLDDLGT